MSGVLLDEQGHVLVVKPTYRAYWLLPGGVVEDNESPKQACRREVQEELQLQVAIDKLLCVDYLPRENEKSECVQFVFYGGRLSQEQIQSIVLPADELSAYRLSLQCMSRLGQTIMLHFEKECWKSR